MAYARVTCQGLGKPQKILENAIYRNRVGKKLNLSHPYQILQIGLQTKLIYAS